jgi:SulP family sulfate permease
MSQTRAGDVWGGLSAMLVALPSAIAFGVTIFAPFGAALAAHGAVAGVMGATALGLVAPAVGGTKRLITAPCAPAAAVLSALAWELQRQGVAPEAAVFMLLAVGLLCGVFQIAFGALGLGRLIKYMPYPVVSGYLTGVGLLIVAGQTPKLLGAPKDANGWKALATPALWQWDGILVGVLTMAAMLAAPRLTKTVPAPVLGLAAGLATYFGLAVANPSLRSLEGNHLVVGPIAVSGAGALGEALGRWRHAFNLAPGQLAGLVTPALTLAVLLSIDTLKTCLIVDALTRSRHNSNRELTGQGCGNLAAALAGGIPGAGTMGATLVNISSGAQTQRSGVLAGGFALLGLLLLGPLLAWIPVAALAGILIVIGGRMLDVNSLHLLRQRSTLLDFSVIAAVVVVALGVGLIAASGAGLALAIMLFVREQTGGSVVRGRVYGNQIFSKQVRLPQEMEVLERRGDRSVVYQLQGSLFFGTTDQLFTALEADVKTRQYLILDMRRVQSVDVTAAHMLDQIGDALAERGAFLIFSHFPRRAPTGKDMERYLKQAGLTVAERHLLIFAHLDEALEWVEDQILAEERVARPPEALLELRDIDLFQRRKEETLAALERCMDQRSFKAGERIFAQGEAGDEMFLIRRGAVRITLPLEGNERQHVATFGRGDFFGEMTFLDRVPRSADAVAWTDTDLFALSRARFDALAEDHKRLGMNLLEGIARALSLRLRRANTELRAYHEQ